MITTKTAFVAALHSLLFLTSRIFVLCALILPWRFGRQALNSILLVCICQQIVHHYLRMRFIDMRLFCNRTSLMRINYANGLAVKLVAAFEVYLYHIIRKPSPVNLLHWLECAFHAHGLVEFHKWDSAMRLNLIYRWNSETFVLTINQARVDASSAINPSLKIQNLRNTLLEKCPYLNLATYFPNHSHNFDAIEAAPSYSLWLFWVFAGRSALIQLDDDPRERAYHMDSVAAHYKRWKARSMKRFHSPVVFGVDQSFSFEKGISRRIHVEEVKQRSELLLSLCNDADGLEKEDGEEIDHEQVFCISYRHLGDDKNGQVWGMFTALMMAARLTEERGYDYFHVWLDQIVRQSTREARRWAVDGLLPYAYYPVIAARGMGEDEHERLWLQAEERLAYGNMGLYKINVASMSFEYYDGLDAGAANSLCLYLRFIKCGETVNEKTFHDLDKRRFQEMSDKFGLIDDEDAVYKSLIGNDATYTPKIVQPVWWGAVIDVETYAILRREEVCYQKIAFKKEEGLAFDGFREWFLHHNVRLGDRQACNILMLDTTEMKREIEKIGEQKWLLGHFVLHRFAAIYVIEGNANERRLVLIRKYASGGMFGSACIALHSVKTGGQWSIGECVRIQLRYEAVSSSNLPDDEAYIDAAMQLFPRLSVSSLSTTCVFRPAAFPP